MVYTAPIGEFFLSEIWTGWNEFFPGVFARQNWAVLLRLVSQLGTVLQERSGCCGVWYPAGYGMEVLSLLAVGQGCSQLLHLWWAFVHGSFHLQCSTSHRLFLVLGTFLFSFAAEWRFCLQGHSGLRQVHLDKLPLEVNCLQVVSAKSLHSIFRLVFDWETGHGNLKGAPPEFCSFLAPSWVLQWWFRSELICFSF